VRGLRACVGARGQPRERSLLCGVLEQPAFMSVRGQQSGWRCVAVTHVCEPNCVASREANLVILSIT
jgi:hypothetical protein